MMMGTHAGAGSKGKLRTEADLSPTEGKLILIEYSEEFPPIQLTKGMATKIVTYYRGDKTRCPVSAGGGDRPTRNKRAGDTGSEAKEAGAGQNKLGKPPRLVGPNHALTSSLTDWVGKPPTKTKDDRTSERETIDVLPEGVTEILHPKVHGPFIGEIEDGQPVTGLVSNLFVVPMARHEPEQTDFLMILGRSSGTSIAGRHEVLNVVLRELPTSIFTAGQVEPRARVYAPNTQGEKNFIGPFVSYQIARALTRSEDRDGHGLRFDEIQDRVLPNLGLAANNLRQRLKYVANYDKNSSIWTTKNIGYEDYPGVDALGKEIQAEGVAAWEMACAAVRRLTDLGIYQLFSGSHAVGSVGVTMIYLAGQVNATRELARKMKKLSEVSRSNRSISPLQVKYYEEASKELEVISKAMRRRHEVAKFIYEELQLAPWHLTGEFIDVHKKGEGTGMMKLTGLGDPSGIGEGYSFIREQDTKPSKSVGGGMKQNAEMKKITGTEDDLRKLTMKQMARILRSYGMAQKQIDTLKRWDRVHVIRDLSTKAASDGIGDGLERFARGEKLKLSEQKQIYRDRIQVIWKRQLAALSIDPSEGRAGEVGGDVGEAGDDAARSDQAKKNEDAEKEESDSESEDDDFAAAMEAEMMDRSEANMLVAAQARDAGGAGGDAPLGQLRNAAQDKDLSKDARELAALKRQREEERQTREGLASLAPKDHGRQIPLLNRKIIRKKIIKTHPDGRQTISFKFIVHPEEVGQVMARLAQQYTSDRVRLHDRPEYQPDEKQIGHSIFEDEDDYELSNRGRGSLKRRGRGRGRGGSMARAMPRFGKLKSKMSTSERMKKRLRDDDEFEVYESIARRKGTSNRKERGSIRERRPHVIMADRLETIRAGVEARPASGPFHKPVNRRQWPQYYEKISNPIDLATIRDKIQKYEYRTADSFLKDFELMKSNAIKFNGPGAIISEEAATIYDQVKEKVEESRAELTHLEEAVDEQLNTKPKKRRKKGSPKGSGGGFGSDIMDIDFNFDGMSDSDSD
jgi:transcription initiation factor TFIID subunit 1